MDFVYVASGTATMRHAGGDASLDAGETIVQRGIDHAWINLGDVPCRLVNVSVPAILPASATPPTTSA